MNTGWKYILAAVSAGALVGSLVSTAFAGKPGGTGAALQSHAPTGLSVGGALTVDGVAKFNSNLNVSKKPLYAHGGAQVWKSLKVNQGGLTVADGVSIQKGGLTVSAGGTHTDSLLVDTSMKAADAEISGNVTSGPIASTGSIVGTSFTAAGSGSTGGTLNLSNGNNTVALTNTGNSTISTTGTISAGNLTTTGTFSAANLSTAGQLTTGSIVDNGTLQAQAVAASGSIQGQSVTATGTVQATTGNLTNLNVTGAINFTNATVTGLSLSQLSGSGQLAALTVGTTSATTPPFTVSENSKTAQIGVNSSGAVTVDNLAVGSGLTLSGGLTLPGNTSTTGLIASQIAGPGNTPGALTITSSGLNINGPIGAGGDLTLKSGHDLELSTGTGFASHIDANSDADVAGVVTVHIPAAGLGPFTQSVPFSVPYSTAPMVQLTPTVKPSQFSTAGVNYWVVPSSSGFIVNVAPDVAAGTAYDLSFDYQVVGP
jgi:hypothetical protein